MKNENGKVLVTGGTGFIGSHLVDRLIEKGHDVRCLVRKTSSLKYLTRPEIEFVHGGLDSETDWDQVLENVHTVYHVAGLTFARRRHDYYRVNHKGTESVVAAALKYRNTIRRLVHVSSLAAVGPGANGQPVDEGTAPAPITAYGKSKLLAEEAVLAASEILPVTIVRPPAVYGPRDYAVFEFFKTISRGLSPMIGAGDKKISLVHGFDLADGLILAGESDAAIGRIYFISSEETYSMRDVAELLAATLGRRVRTLIIPKPVAFGAALLAEAGSMLLRRPPIINRDKVTDLSQSCWACSPGRARVELGYRQRVPLEEGLRTTVEWYRSEGWL